MGVGVAGAGGVVGGRMGAGRAAGRAAGRRRLQRAAAVGPGLVVQAHAELAAALAVGAAGGRGRPWGTNQEGGQDVRRGSMLTDNRDTS